MAIRPLAFIFDIDGTLSDNTHRQHHLTKTPKDWDAFFAAQKDDVPVDALVRIFKSLVMDYAILFVTGRKESSRDETVMWLGRALEEDQQYINAHLWMRSNGDRTEDYLFKKKLFLENIQNDYQVIAVFEDRNKVVDMWRSLGIPTLQVAPGDY